MGTNGSALRGALLGAAWVLATHCSEQRAAATDSAAVTDVSTGADISAGTATLDIAVQDTPADSGASSPDLKADATTLSWQAFPPLPAPRQEHAVVAWNERLIVVGGYAGTGFGPPSTSVLAWQSGAANWTALPDLPEALHHAHAAVLDGKLYVAGFLTGFDFAHDGRGWTLTEATAKWTSMPGLPAATARGGGCATAWKGQLWVLGGLRSLKSVASVDRFDVATQAWVAGPALPEARDHLACGVVADQLVVAGGRNGGVGNHSPKTWTLATPGGAWQSRALMAVSRGGVAAAVWQDRLVVAGGEGNKATKSGVFAEVEAYDLAADAWIRLPDMAVPRHGNGAAVVGGRLHVPGGATVQLFGAVADHDGLGP
ncbi:MAG: kelch-like protein [Myxococcales bacterium]|nr:kelch-like protein [Myxococcales bacterium]